MTINHKPENTSKTNAAHPSLGKLSADQAIRRFELRGFWASMKNGQIRVIEFIEKGNDSSSKTHWFDEWEQALEHFGIRSNISETCPKCGIKSEDAQNRSLNRAGDWLCTPCEYALTETGNDLFYLSQGGWKV